MQICVASFGRPQHAQTHDFCNTCDSLLLCAVRSARRCEVLFEGIIFVTEDKRNLKKLSETVKFFLLITKNPTTDKHQACKIIHKRYSVLHFSAVHSLRLGETERQRDRETERQRDT